jgi:hypothetical protein
MRSRLNMFVAILLVCSVWTVFEELSFWFTLRNGIGIRSYIEVLFNARTRFGAKCYYFLSALKTCLLLFYIVTLRTRNFSTLKDVTVIKGLKESSRLFSWTRFELCSRSCSTKKCSYLMFVFAMPVICTYVHGFMLLYKAVCTRIDLVLFSYNKLN